MLAVLIVCFGPALLLAGCGPSEPERRRAFIAFLETQALPAPGARLQMIDQLTADRIGDYRGHYAVISRFQAAMNLSVAGPLREAVSKSAPRSPEDDMALRARLAKLRRTLDRAEERANEKRAALAQPDDLAPVYALAFEKLVTRPAADLRGEIAAALAGLPRGPAR